MMTEEARKVVNRLKYLNEVAYGYHIDGCVMGMKVDEFESMMEQAADMIERLSAELEAAKRDLGILAVHPDQFCNMCKHYLTQLCIACDDYEWEWRGLCAENGGADNG